MVDIDKDLDLAFEEAIEEAEEEKAKRFEITDLGKAEWATKKIAQRQAAIAEIKAAAQERIKAYEAWCEEQVAPLQRDINFFEMLLRPYAEAELQKLGKGKTCKLPNGCNLKFAKAKETYEYDDAKLLQFFKDNQYSDYIKVETKEKAQWGEFKKSCEITEDGKLVCTLDGTLVDVVKVIPAGEDKFSVDVKGLK